jgi:cytochrome c biogenesis protein CcmG, thiol:disulfide interchange protein DsbE
MNTFLVLSNITLWIAVSFLIVLVFALIRKVNTLGSSNSIKDPNILENGTTAPNFYVKKLDDTGVQLIDFLNKEIILVFISSLCEPCRDQMPILSQLQSKARQQDKELLLINLESMEQTHKYLESLNFDVSIFAADQEVNVLRESYKIVGTPSYYRIDRNGIIVSGGLLDKKWEEMVKVWSTEQ